MLYYPRLLSERFFDDFMNFGWPDFSDFDSTQSKLYGKRASRLMSTDVHESDAGYELDIDLPGFKKDEIQLELQDGYLTVSAAKGLDEEDKDDKGKVLRRERFAGSVSRSFFVGDAVDEDDVKARFEDGVLSLSVPKKEKELPQKKTILIEG